MPPTLDSFLKSFLGADDVSVPSSSKRSRDSSANSDDSSESKKAKTSPEPSLKKSTNPQWGGPRFSMRAPTTPSAKKCINKWDLLAPFDTTITEKQWKEYFEERTAVENLNTPGTEEFKRLKSEEIMQKPERLLPRVGDRLAKIIMGSCMEDDEKNKIADTLRGSLYYLDLWGCEEDGLDKSDTRTDFMPRTVSAKTRLYSPFGIGSSVDFNYYYFNHHFRENQQCNACVVSSRDIDDCNGNKPYECAASMTGRGMIGPPDEGSVRLFEDPGWGEKVIGTTTGTMSEFQDTLFACSGWLSPRLMFDLLYTGATAMIYQEQDKSSVRSTQYKFKLFAGEVEDAELEIGWF